MVHLVAPVSDEHVDSSSLEPTSWLPVPPLPATGLKEWSRTQTTAGAILFYFSLARTDVAMRRWSTDALCLVHTENKLCYERPTTSTTTCSLQKVVLLSLKY